MNTILIAMIHSKGKQNNRAVRKSCRQWYPLAVSGFDAAVKLTKVILGQSIIPVGFRPFKRQGSMSGK